MAGFILVVIVFILLYFYAFPDETKKKKKPYKSSSQQQALRITMSSSRPLYNQEVESLRRQFGEDWWREQP
jgi:hypothetical protein